MGWPENEQFPRDQFPDRPAPAPLPRFLELARPLTAAAVINGKLSVLSRCGITGRSFAAEQFQRRLKSFLPGFDQLGFLGHLFAQGERGLSVNFQIRQVHASSFE